MVIKAALLFAEWIEPSREYSFILKMSLIFLVSGNPLRLFEYALWCRKGQNGGLPLSAWFPHFLPVWVQSLLFWKASPPDLELSIRQWSLWDHNLPPRQQPFTCLSLFPIVCQPRHTRPPGSTSNPFWTVLFIYLELLTIWKCSSQCGQFFFCSPSSGSTLFPSSRDRYGWMLGSRHKQSWFQELF